MRLCSPCFLFQVVVVVVEQSVVERMKLGVAVVKLQLAELWVVEEEASAEVVDCFLGLWQELVGDEGDLIACLAEEFGEERIVAPVAFLAHNVCREDVLEDEAGEVPASHDIGKLGELARLFERCLAWCRLHEVAILLGVMSAVALAYDEHDVRRAVAATVYPYVFGGMYELCDLFGGQLVGVDAESQSVDRNIEFGVSLVGELVLHFAYVLASEELECRHLVVPRGAGSCYEDDDAYHGQGVGRGTGNARHPVPSLLERQQFDEGDGKAQTLDDGLAEGCHKGLYEDEQQNPSHGAEDDGRREAG